MTTTTDVTTAELDAGDLAQGWAALAAGQQPTRRAEILWGARTDIGRARENNEDKFDFFVPDAADVLAARGSLWAVADGMGGHNAGQVASENALKSLIRGYFSDTKSRDPEAALTLAITEANALLNRAASQFGSQNGMGTTVVVAVVRGDKLTIAHVGDSRIYLLRQGEPIRQLTTDHSWVEEQVRRGNMSREQAEASPYRNYILRSVGVADSVDVDVATETLKVGDTVLLCSDGLTGYLDGEVLAGLIRDKNPSQAAFDLIDAANDRGGRDNITALLLKVRSIDDRGAETVATVNR